MELYLGLVIPSAIPYAPVDTAFCIGQQVSVGQNQALYAVIGNIFGGNTVNFNLPDLRGRVPVGVGQGPGLSPYLLGVQNKNWGQEEVYVSIQNMPAHTHDAASQVNTNYMGVVLSPITAAANGTLNVTQTSPPANPTNVPGTVGGNVGYPGVIPDLSGGGISDNNFYGAWDGANTMPVNVNVHVSQPVASIVADSGAVTTSISSTGGGVPLLNIQPVQPLNYLMIMLGIFPPRQ